MLKWSKEKSVKNFVYCSTEQVLLGGPTIMNADETWPYPKPEDMCGPYAWSKAEAEKLVLASSTDSFKAVSIRPRLVWGKGDTTLLAKISEAVRTGQWMWIGYGEFNTSTCHVRNCVEGLIKGAQYGRGGEAYFVTDGKPVNFKDFMTRMLSNGAGVDASQSWGVPQFMGTVSSWFGLVPSPVVRLFGEECTVNDTKARRELGYTSSVTIEEGLQELAAEHKN
eukprot:TRINITY_DN1173_c0_g1_i2.p1 TRINITY_DN1173_c0_g1~~TRINITY_DN1173_c0_g1_i2.p1  ORF type:complete len:223 (-),score=55.72 TRINITY_DN1173_c0_g1_i2:104-772(-)